MLRDKIQKAILEANLEPELKKALSISLSALADHQTALLAELKNNLIQEASARPAIPPISTALVDQDIAAKLGYCGFVEAITSTPDTKIWFINTPYDKALDLCARKFKGLAGNGEIEWQMRPITAWVDKEREIDLLWRLYGVNAPAPFSPWARRAVRLFSPEADEFDPCLEKQGLADILLGGKTIVWNVETREDESWHRIAPAGDEAKNIYHYTARDVDIFLWPLPLDVLRGDLDPEEIDARIGENEIALYCRKEFSRRECLKFAIQQTGTNPALQAVYDNSAETMPFFMPRSQGDFNRLLNGFAKDGFSCFLTKQPSQPITRYATHFRVENRHYLANSQERKMYVRFSGDGLFLTDYANWVLNELEKRLPQFCWVGVV